jgi:ABC-type multidrug transport system ATPase subunit
MRGASNAYSSARSNSQPLPHTRGTEDTLSYDNFDILVPEHQQGHQQHPQQHAEYFDDSRVLNSSPAVLKAMSPGAAYARGKTPHGDGPVIMGLPHGGGTGAAPAIASAMLDPTYSNSCALSWQHISYWVHEDRVVWRTHDRTPQRKRQDKEGKRLLFEITGRCGPGEITAVMGPSGSGKTTLLDILADRVRTGTVDGYVRLNGSERTQEVFRGVSSYISRDESLLGSLTVRETLVIAGELSLPTYMPRTVRDLRVETVLDNMGLRNCQDTLVGSMFHKGLSSGQKRRLSIAIELLSNPSILLLDEPTSGLDSAAAFGVMQCLVDLCQEWNKTVVLTIHQPPSACYALFTNTLVLAEGKSVYFGRSDKAVEYFAAIGYHCSIYSNPAEHMLSLVNRDFDGHADVDDLADRYSRSSVSRETANLITDDWRNANSFPEIRADIGLSSPFAQFRVMLHRNGLIAIRNPGMYWIRIVMYMILSLLLGTVYLRGNKDITDLHRAALLFYLQAFLVFMSVAVVPFFIEQRATFVRERMNHSVRVSSFVVANFFSFIPGIFAIALASTAIVVGLTGLNQFPTFLLNMFLSLVVAESFMCVISALSPHYISGIAVGAGIYGMFMVVEGFMVPVAALPVYWRWLHYVAFHSYAFQSFMYDHFHTEGTVEATAVLNLYGLQHVDIMQNMLILAGYAVGLQIIFALVLFKRTAL